MAATDHLVITYAGRDKRTNTMLPPAVPVGELLEVVAGVWAGHPYSHDGRWFSVQDGGFWGGPQTADGGRLLERRPSPAVFLDGTDDAHIELSARFADVHLFDLDEPSAVADGIERLRARAAGHGRTVRYGLRLPIWAREFTDEAWRDLRRVVPDASAGGSPRWRGFDRLGVGRPAGLVGSFEDVAASLSELAGLGVSVLVLEGVAPIEDAYRLGEFVLPSVQSSVHPVTTGVSA